MWLLIYVAVIYYLVLSFEVQRTGQDHVLKKSSPGVAMNRARWDTHLKVTQNNCRKES
jgi:hypothetical protein